MYMYITVCLCAIVVMSCVCVVLCVVLTGLWVDAGMSPDMCYMCWIVGRRGNVTRMCYNYVGLWVDLEHLHTEPCGGSGPYTITNPLFHFDVAAQSRAHDKLLNNVRNCREVKLI